MKDAVTQVRELANGFRVTLNDRSSLRLTRADQRTLALREGDRVNEAELRHTLLLSQYPAALNRAVRLLAVRARSCYEIEKRLADACYLDDTVEMVLEKLRGEGFVNDAAFAAQWAGDRSARQIGSARILYELRQKGVDEAIARQAVEALEDKRQAESAAALAAKLWKRYRAYPAADARRKAMAAMQRRGYAYAEAERALHCATDADGADGAYDDEDL